MTARLLRKKASTTARTTCARGISVLAELIRETAKPQGVKGARGHRLDQVTSGDKTNRAVPATPPSLESPPLGPVVVVFDLRGSSSMSLWVNILLLVWLENDFCQTTDLVDLFLSNWNRQVGDLGSGISRLVLTPGSRFQPPGRCQQMPVPRPQRWTLHPSISGGKLPGEPGEGG